MNQQKSRLEDLPNEILSCIFENLNARDLFRAFYQLNSRLNHIVQSFQHLQLFYHMNGSYVLKTNDDVFSYYVYTLVVNPWINFNLQHFPNIRRLRLDSPLPKVLEQLQPDVMPYLEYISIHYTYNMYEMGLLHEKIFSNRFLHLKSCELYDRQTLIKIPNWTETPSIRALQTDFIDSFVYKIILCACPNLYFFKFWMYSLHGIPTDVPIHKNLKRMIIELAEVNWFYDDNTISGFLECVPNLEQLEIHRRTYSEHIREYIDDYDWFAKIIHGRLPMLRKFTFYFHLSADEKLNEIFSTNKLVQIQSDFVNVHTGQYEAQLIIDRKSSL